MSELPLTTLPDCINEMLDIIAEEMKTTRGSVAHASLATCYKDAWIRQRLKYPDSKAMSFTFKHDGTEYFGEWREELTPDLITRYNEDTTELKKRIAELEASK